MMRMIASAGTVLLLLLALVDDISCVVVVVLSSVGEAGLLFTGLRMN
jgi:hypothetical protein